MGINDIHVVLNKLEQLSSWNRYFAIFLTVALGFSIWYFKRKTEKIAEETSEKTLKKFQTDLDKEMLRFKTKHQKQVDAIHETYQGLQKLKTMIEFSISPEPFSQPLKGSEELQYLVNFRHEFKKSYQLNKLIFPEYLCEKIEKLLPVIDKYIETFQSGLLPDPSPEEMEQNQKYNDGVFVAGIYSVNAFEGQLEQLQEISKDIEKEFRNIYGT